MQKLSVLLYALAYLVLFSTWSFIVYQHVDGAEALVHYIEQALGWLTAHVLTVLLPGGSPPGPSAPAVVAPRASSAQAGHASPAMLLAAALVSVALMCGCSLLPQNFSRVEEGAAQAVVQSSERTICRDIPIGTWMRLYGTSADRIKGWQAICFNPLSAPLNDATVAAIQKVYPSFQQAVEAGASLPAAGLVPALPSDSRVPK